PTSKEKDIQHVLRSLSEHNILGDDLNPVKHRQHPYTTKRTADLMVKGVVKLVHGGYSKFIKRMEEEKLEEEFALERDVDELMRELDEEVKQADAYIQDAFK
ncbi:hypothetical protein BGZ83_002122, partial [Gryganskiella cystojenkinii]